MVDLLLPTSSYRELTIDEVLRRKAAIDEAAARASPGQYSAAPDVIERALDVTTCRHNGLEIERDIPVDRNSEGSRYPYDKSIARFRALGFERHLRASEAMGVLIDEASSSMLKQYMMRDTGEWVDLMFLRKRDTLHCYEGVSNVVLDYGMDDTELVVVGGDLKFTKEQSFNVAGLPSGVFTHASRLSFSLHDYLFGMPHAQLPIGMKHTSGGAGVVLPDDYTLSPVSRLYYCFHGSRIETAASRGCRESKRVIYDPVSGRIING